MDHGRIPTSEENGMFGIGSGYSGKWARRIGIPLAATVAVVLGFGAVANAAPVHVKRGDTFSALVRTHCGTNDWESVAFPGRNKNKIYAGETIDITCANKASKSTARPKPAPKKPSAKAPSIKTSSGWFAPLIRTGISNCNFWQRRVNNSGKVYYHHGEDWPAGYGTPIRAAHSGKIVTGYDGGRGNYSIVTFGNIKMVYMHQSRYAKRSGTVRGGDVIGYVGSTGDSTGNHLHFEIYVNGKVTNPVTYLKNHRVSVGC